MLSSWHPRAGALFVRNHAMSGLVVGILLLLANPVVANAETIHLYAAGSLKAALTEVARAFEAKIGDGAKIELQFAASGLLRERIEKGETVHVFASADLGHPTKLADGGYAKTKVTIFARNQLCALAREGLKVTPANLLDTLLDPGVRLGISTPKADPSGDYAFALFAKAEARKPGARTMLEAKALQLTGGPASEKAPAGRNQYAWVMASGKADVFLTYCTNAVLARKEVAGLQIVQVPPELNVGADYGIIVLKAAPKSSDQLAEFILGEEGQSILVKHGFGRGNGVPK
jgi:molybdate transport system substrate-binding protein